MHFIKSDSGGKCKHCLLNVKTSGNTTNLRNHMIRKHKYHYESKRQMESKRPSGKGGEQMQVCMLMVILLTTLLESF